MMPLTLSLACVPSDRIRPILDGRVRIEGCVIEPALGEPEAIFGRALSTAEFAVTELSMASHIVRVANGTAAYAGVPAFTSRAFRHGSIFIRTDRGITRPEDLAGRRLGVPDYQQTAALWMRGILSEQYDVPPDSIRWLTGGLDHPVEGQRGGLTLPPHIDVAAVGPGDCLNDALKRGEIDGIIAPKPPACFVDGSAPVARLFPDFGAVERRFAEASGFFPIMHCMAVRRDLAQEHPWLPLAVFRAFAEAKALALKELVPTNVLRLSLPWLSEHAAEARRILGARFWSYGLPENKREIEAMIRYAASDGLIASPISAAALFAASTHNLEDVA
ncbi:MAG TPA: ABC transporter substrate-binding protein [Stellaceae bacterium]|jgi:4,5-dihydroxyphthalate decarboxylase|nr:ABC transporter substrate-binding protein [Stellaceae bacterium]